MTTLSSLVKGKRSKSGSLKPIDFLEEIDDAFHEDFIERLSCVDKYFTKSSEDVGPLIPEVDEYEKIKQDFKDLLARADEEAYIKNIEKLNSMQKKHKRDCEQIRDSDILWQAKKDYKRLFGNKNASKERPEPSIDAVVKMLELGLLGDAPYRPEETLHEQDSSSKTDSPSRRKSSTSSSIRTEMESLIGSID